MAKAQAPLSNDTLALLNAYDGVATATPDDGSRAVRYPPNGINTLELVDVILDGPNEKTTFGSKDHNVPGFYVNFVWRYLPAIDGDGQPFIVYGQRFKLPVPAARADAMALPSQKEGGWKKNIEMTESFLANHIQVLLGRPAGKSLGADIAAIAQKMKAGKITVSARTRTWESDAKKKDGTPYTNFAENLQELLSA